MAVLIESILLDTIFLNICLHYIDEITVYGLEYRFHVHIILRITHLTPIRILMPGNTLALALGGPSPCLGLVSVSLEAEPVEAKLSKCLFFNIS